MNCNSSPESSPQAVDPNITRNLTADYEALKNDLEQATIWAGELKSELAANKNDAAHFKQLFEKTSRDLEHMQQSIVALRKERHCLANEAMKASCLQMKLDVITKERDTLAMLLAKEQEKDAQIVDLTMQLTILKNSMEQSKKTRTSLIEAKAAEIDFLERFAQ